VIKNSIVINKKKLFMKKTFLFLIIALITISCEDPSKDITVNAATGTNIPNAIDIKVKSSDWILNSDTTGVNTYYTYHYTLPAITSSVYDTATINSFILTSSPVGLQTLPYAGHLQNVKGTSWTQTIDFDYAIGSINMYVTNSGLNADPPGSMDFNVVIK
jgi:hypothetical protein